MADGDDATVKPYEAQYHFQGLQTRFGKIDCSALVGLALLGEEVVVLRCKSSATEVPEDAVVEAVKAYFSKKTPLDFPEELPAVYEGVF